MSIIKRLKFKIFGPNLSTLLVPTSLLIGLVLLSTYSVRVGFKNAITKFKELQESQKKERILEEKLTTLNQLQNVILGKTEVSILALPSENPALLGISQLKSLANENTVFIHDNELGASVKFEEEITKAILSSTLDGEMNSIINFLKNIPSLAPLMNLDEIQIKTISGTSVRSEIKTAVFWSALPTKFSSITEPVSDLSSEERQILERISNLKIPSFTVVTPQAPGTREDPFN